MPLFFIPPRAKVSKTSLGHIFFSEDISSRFELTRDISSSWVELRQKKLNDRQIVKYLCEKISQMDVPFKIKLRSDLFDRWWRVLPVEKALDENVQTMLETIESLRLSVEDKAFFNERVLLKWWLISKSKMSSSNHVTVITSIINKINLFSLDESEKNSFKLYFLNQWVAGDSRLKSERIFKIAPQIFDLKDVILLQMEFVKEWWEHLIQEESSSSAILQELEDITKMPFVEQEKHIHTQKVINLIKGVNENKFLIEAILVHLLKEITQSPKSLKTQERMQIILLRQYGVQLIPKIYLEKISNLLKHVPLSDEQRRALKFNLFADVWRKLFKEQELLMTVENALTILNNSLTILNRVVQDKEDEDLFQKALLNYWLEESGDLKFAIDNILKLSLCNQELAVKLLAHLWQHLRKLDFSAYKIISLTYRYWRDETFDLEILVTSLLRQWWPQFEFSNLDTYLFLVEKMEAIEEAEALEKFEDIEESVEEMDLFSGKIELIEKAKAKIVEKNLLIREKKESQSVELLKKWVVKLKESGFSKVIIFKEIIIEVSRSSFLERSKRKLQSELMNQLWNAAKSEEDAEKKPLFLFFRQLFKMIEGVSLPLKEKDFLITQLQIRYEKELASCVRRLSFSDDSMEELEELQIRDILPEEAVSASEVNELGLDIKKALPVEEVVIAGDIKEPDFDMTHVVLARDAHRVQHAKEMFKPCISLRKPLEEARSSTVEDNYYPSLLLFLGT